MRTGAMVAVAAAAAAAAAVTIASGLSRRRRPMRKPTPTNEADAPQQAPVRGAEPGLPDEADQVVVGNPFVPVTFNFHDLTGREFPVKVIMTTSMDAVFVRFPAASGQKLRWHVDVGDANAITIAPRTREGASGLFVRPSRLATEGDVAVLLLELLLPQRASGESAGVQATAKLSIFMGFTVAR